MSLRICKGEGKAVLAYQQEYISNTQEILALGRIKDPGGRDFEATTEGFRAFEETFGFGPDLFRRT